jgi:hypothetical protein
MPPPAPDFGHMSDPVIEKTNVFNESLEVNLIDRFC